MISLNFGTDGVRDTGFSQFFTRTNLNRFASAFSSFMHHQPGSQSPQIFLLHDTRDSSKRIAQELITAFVGLGIQVFYCGVLPTPAGLFFCQQQPVTSFSIVVTASHNPFFDNGIKVFYEKGKLSCQQEKEMQHFFNQAEKPVFSALLHNNIVCEKNFGQRYVSNLLSFFAGSIFSNYRFLVDCANGSTTFLAKQVFQALGAQVDLLNANPNGFNINVLSGSESLLRISRLIRIKKYDCGIIFDGDGDRVKIVLPGGQVLDGDDWLAFFAAEHSVLVGTVMSNVGLDGCLQGNNAELIRSDVGDRNLAVKMKEAEASLGAEPSGHIIFSDYLWTGDGLFSSIKFLEKLFCQERSIYTGFARFPQKHIDLKISRQLSLSSGKLAKVLMCAQKMMPFGRVFARYSGTQNLFRLLLEDKDCILLERVSCFLAQELTSIFQNEA